MKTFNVHSFIKKLFLTCAIFIPINAQPQVRLGEGLGEYLIPNQGLDREIPDEWRIKLSDLKKNKIDLQNIRPTDSAPILSRTCTSVDDENFRGVRGAITEIILSADDSHLANQNSIDSRGKFLMCLKKSGLEVMESRIKNLFFRNATFPLLTCDWSRNSPNVAADSAVSRKQITVFQQYSQISGIAGSNYKFNQVPQTYSNVIFHELIHVGSALKTEEIVYTVVGCCGEGNSRRGEACQALDATVARDSKIVLLEKKIRSTGPFNGITEIIGIKNTKNLIIEFYNQLEANLRGLNITADTLKCSNNVNDETCEKIISEIREVAAFTLTSNCQNFVQGGQEECVKIPEAEKMRVIDALVKNFKSS